MGGEGDQALGAAPDLEGERSPGEAAPSEKPDRATGVVSATLRAGELDDAPPTLDFELSHPAFADRDHLIKLRRAQPDADGNPVWVGHLVAVPGGRYYAVLRAGDTWRLSAEWQGEANLALRPGGNDDP
jgi:hypothetical protein